MLPYCWKLLSDTTLRCYSRYICTLINCQLTLDRDLQQQRMQPASPSTNTRLVLEINTISSILVQSYNKVIINVVKNELVNKCWTLRTLKIPLPPAPKKKIRNKITNRLVLEINTISSTYTRLNLEQGHHKDNTSEYSENKCQIGYKQIVSRKIFFFAEFLKSGLNYLVYFNLSRNCGFLGITNFYGSMGTFYGTRL